MNFFIENNRRESQFEVSIDGHTAFVEYSILSKTITFLHTEVPLSLKGRGIASALAKYALEFAMDNKLRVIPKCAYIQAYIRQHEQYRSLVKIQFD